MIKAIPGNVWRLSSSKEIKYTYDKILDLSIPFDRLDIGHNETLEFLFINANLGIQDLCIPNDMLLTVTRM